MANKANEEAFNELHILLTDEITKRIRTGEATTADLRAAIDWLKVNNITGVAVENSPLANLIGVIPELTFDDVAEHI